mmetsp:Transcript_38412/g.123175  ORF Transcript_38412/g.123175 Transcript_38412/m.123175 type:complete len:239 (+) Transcript_38412:1001-1717(+)
MTRESTRFDSSASLPPFKISPQPARNARVAICGRASGRDSKMIRTTPNAQVRFSKMRPGLSSRFSTTSCTGSPLAARASVPSITVSSFFSERPRRCFKWGSKLLVAKFAMSVAFASKIAFLWSAKPAATRRRSSDRSVPVSDCKARDASRTFISFPSSTASSSSGSSGAAPESRDSGGGSFLWKNSVPTSPPPSRILETTPGSCPDARATHFVPNNTARFAAATLASMPPRPLRDLSP